LGKVSRVMYEGTVLGELHEVEEVYERNERGESRIECTNGVQTVIDGDARGGFEVDINPKLEEDQRKKLKALLEHFSSQFALSSADLGHTSVGECELQLIEGARPVNRSPYRTSHSEKQVIRLQVEEMLANGIIRSSRSGWSSGVVLVKKKNGEYRFCVDYRGLNKMLSDDSYPLPVIDDLLSYLEGSKYFSSLDLFSGYWQLPMAEESIHLTAFCTNEGLYEFLRLPFGVKTAPKLFQRSLDLVLAGLKWSECILYLDDVLVMASSFKAHLQRLRHVLERFQEAGLTLNPKKCSFGYTEVPILGHVVSAEGISPNRDKIKAVLEFTTPTSLKQVRSFIGMAGFYRKFVKDFAGITRPLTALSRKGVKFSWGVEQEQAFRTLQRKLVEAPVLRHFSPENATELHTDASNHGIGGVLN
jgi:Reverse transcriptase (RNA-dependent DNA polymerase)/RNase H-like domain found in reverse transcriptase